MIITFDEEELNLMLDVADRYNINPVKLQEAYKNMVQSNLEQDLHDLSKEWEEELR